MFGRAGNGNESKIRRRSRKRGFVTGDATRTHKHDLAGLLRMQTLRLPRKVERLFDIQRRSSGLGLIDGLLDFLAIGFE